MRMYQRGDVVYIRLPKIEGSHVQGGMRPCVIVQNNVGNRYELDTVVSHEVQKVRNDVRTIKKLLLEVLNRE